MPYANIQPGNFYQNPSLQYGPMLPGQDRGVFIPGTGMNPYWAGPRFVGVGGYGADASPTSDLPKWVMPVAIGGVALFVGWIVVQHFKILSKVAEKEGSAGVLKMELGEAALGVGARLADRALGGGERYTTNRRKSRRRRRA